VKIRRTRQRSTCPNGHVATLRIFLLALFNDHLVFHCSSYGPCQIGQYIPGSAMPIARSAVSRDTAAHATEPCSPKRPSGENRLPPRHTRATRSRATCDGRTPGPHTRGTRSLPVKSGHVDSRPGRSDLVSPKRPRALARVICPTDAHFELFRWRTTCDHHMAHQSQPRSGDFPGTSKSQARPPVKGLILCKPTLDHWSVLHCAPDTGAPRGCHVAPFPRLNSRRCPKLRPSSAETGPMGPETRVSQRPLRVSEGGVF